MFAPPALSADWPMWRGDAQRSGATGEDLPKDLHLQWVRRLSRPTTAWPSEPRLQFDACDEPVVLGGRVFVPSSRNGSVTAFDADSGERLWQFFTDGPVRLAPAAAGDQVFIASDDGCLVCLDATAGTLRWRCRGGPDARKHLGNERLVSLWPARGGPVIVGDGVYFAAGIWPVMGVFVHAVDARTGKAIWTNRQGNDLDGLQVDHDFRRTGGIAPQGHLVATADYLIVPNGRSMPAYLDRRTGKLLHYVQGYREGNCRVAACNDVLFIGNYFYPLKNMVRGDNDRFFMDLSNPGPAPMDAFAFSSKFLFGLKERSVVCYAIDKAAAPAVRESNAAPEPWWKRGYSYGGGFSYQTYQTDKAWSFDLPEEIRPKATQLILAGSRLYAGIAKTLIAIDLPEQHRPPRIAWTKPLEAPVSSLLAAAGKLFVVTADHQLLCFGGLAKQHHVFANEASALPEHVCKADTDAAEILRHSGVAEGYCLVLGADSGELALALLAQSKLRLIVIEEDRTRAQALRDRLIDAGHYGSRAEVLVDDPRTIALPPYLASLVVSERFTLAELLSGAARSRSILQAIRPFGGVACLPRGADGPDRLRQLVVANSFDLDQPEIVGTWAVVRRPRGPAGSADWSHPYGDAGNSLFSRDTAVKPPLAVLWYGESLTSGFRGPVHTYENAPPVVTQGVLAGLDGSTVSATDVYTGRSLWQHRLPAEQRQSLPARIAAVDGRVYIACGPRLEVFEAATGRLWATITDRSLPSQDPQLVVRELVVADGVALVLYAPKGSSGKGLADSKLLVAWDCQAGKVLWSRPAQSGYTTWSLATKSMLVVGHGSVFLADTLAPETRWQLRQKGEKADAPCTLLALALRSGDTLWKESLSPNGSAEYLAYCPESALLLHHRQNDKLRAMEAATGKVLWEKPFRTCYAPMMVGPQTFYALQAIRQIHVAGYTVACNVYDIRTGALVRENVFRSEQFNCNYSHGAANLLLRRDCFASWIDMASGHVCQLGNVRSGCTTSLIPAAGLVVAPNLNRGCICNYPLQTSFALVPCEQFEAPPVVLRPGAAALGCANRTIDAKPTAPVPQEQDKQRLDHH